jgi:hypothetical protein
MDNSDLAMVSRIRVEVRGGSMEAAERAAFLLFEHAKMAGYLEGICPQSGEWTDHHFDRPEMRAKIGDAPEAWGELGLPYAGRLTFTFEPEVTGGGLKQFGYTVLGVDRDATTIEGPNADPVVDQVAQGTLVRPAGRDVTREVMVLHRSQPVTRGSVTELDLEVQANEPTKENLDRVCALALHPNVSEFGYSRRPPGWGVDVSITFEHGTMAMGSHQSFFGATLDEALSQAEAWVGEEVPEVPVYRAEGATTS